MSDHGAEAGNGQIYTEPDNTPAGGLAVIVAAGVIVFIAIFASVHGLFEQFDRDELNLKAEQGYGQTYDEVRNYQDERLASYGVGNLETGTFAIPIEQASALVIKELKANPEADVIGPAPPQPPPPAEGGAAAAPPAGTP